MKKAYPPIYEKQDNNIMLCRLILYTVWIFFKEFLTMQVYHGWSSSIYLVPIAVFSVLYNIPKFLELEVSFSLYSSTFP